MADDITLIEIKYARLPNTHQLRNADWRSVVVDVIVSSKRSKKYSLNIATDLTGINNIPAARRISISDRRAEVRWAGN